MALTEMLREPFDSYKSLRDPKADSLIEDVECFASGRSPLRGAVSLHHDENDYSFVVLHPYEHAVYRAIDIKVGIRSRDVTRDGLFAAMTELEHEATACAAS